MFTNKKTEGQIYRDTVPLRCVKQKNQLEVGKMYFCVQMKLSKVFFRLSLTNVFQEYIPNHAEHSQLPVAQKFHIILF